ncbi:hemin receptor [Rhizobium sp. Root73]|nr:hemin receptor [Rhizobium sp. Root1204]KQY05038.1 hemin receptor [Rhizobium sp. Root1334]KRC01673.1 hemin receptor [Rhizobium sp. Root73]
MITRHHCAALLACAAFLTLSPAGHVLAQTPEELAALKKKAEETAPAGEATYLKTITATGGKTGRDPYSTPAATSTITADEVEQFGNRNIDDALRATPGTFTRDNPQNPGLAVNIRGLEGSGRVNMMIDGVRQNFRFTGHEAQGFAYIDPAFISGIDISRGAVSGVGGAGALAGAANMRTYNIEDLLTDGKNYGGFATASFGSNRSGWSESALGAYRVNDSIAFLGGISKKDPGNYKNGNGEVVPYTESDLISGIFKTEITPNDEHSLKLSGILYNNDFIANSYDQTINAQTYSANYAYTPGNDLIDFRANIYYNDIKMKYDQSPMIPGGGSAAGRVVDDKGFGFDVSNTSNFDLGAVAVTSNYGVEYFSDDYDVVNSRLAPSSGVNGSGKSSTTSVFNSTKLTYGMADLTLGLRYDRFDLKGNGQVSAGNPLGMPAGPYSVDSSEGRLNPSVTFALNPVDWLQPYVKYAETSRGPTVNETFVGGTHPGGGAPQFFFPNPFLEPEISKGWEIGANIKVDDLLTAGDSFRFRADYFNNDVDNYITANFIGGTHFANVPGTTKVQGIELEGAYDAGFVFANVSYTHTESDLPSQVNGFGAQSYLPDDIFTATLGARFLEDHRLTVGGRLYAVSESYIGEVNVAPGQSPYQDGYELVDIFTNYKFKNGFEVTASVLNVFDKEYTPALSTSPSITVDTGRGRTFLLTAKATF